MRTSSPPGSEQVLLELEGMLLTSERLVARRCTWRLADVRSVRTQRQRPGLAFPFLVAGLSSAFGIPALLWILHLFGLRTEQYLEIALCAAGVVLFSSVAWLLSAHDSYWLVLGTDAGDAKAYVHSNPELLAEVAVAVGAAIPHREPRTT